MLIPYLTMQCSADDVQLNATNAAERMKARNLIVKMYDNHVDQAISILQGSNKTDDDLAAKVLAIDVVEKLRAIRAIPVLISNVEMDSGWLNLTEASSASIGEMYPAARALVAIGKPSVPYCLTAIGQGEEKKREILCWVVENIVGRESAVLMLRKRLSKADGKVQHAFQAALDLLKNNQK